MAQKAISEYVGKKLIFHHIKKYLPNFEDEYQGIQINEETLKTLKKLPKFPEGYVAKPDQLFGKRGKNKLIYADKSGKKAITWIKENLNETAVVKRNDKDKGIKGTLTDFVIEPFIGHEVEFYVAFKTIRDKDIIYISTEGGIEIEENWDKVTEFKVPFKIDPIPLPQSLKKNMLDILGDEAAVEFISALYQVFKELNFTYIEINPLTVVEGHVYILDLVARLDDTALYKRYADWTEPLGVKEFHFPTPFGKELSLAEKKIKELDNNSGAALKFSLLNPQGRVWLLASGGGASIILADTVGGLGHAADLANYSDFSGNPNTDESAQFASVIIQEMLKSRAKNKVLIIAGGIANFTDVKATYRGVVDAIEQHGDAIKSQGIKIFVRRGGPNYKEGLAYVEDKISDLEIPVEVHGPELYMTEIIALALTGNKEK